MAHTLKSSNDNIVHVPYDININVNRALSEHFLENLTKNSDKIAQVDSHTGRTETFGELLNRSISLAQALKTKGVTTNDIVAICCHNNMDYMVTIIASVFIGARFTAMDISAQTPAIIHCIKLTAPTIMFCEQEHEDLIASSIKEAQIKCDIITYDKTDKFISMENFVQKFKSDEQFAIDTSRKLKDTGCITFTSGTSGLSKGAQLSNFALYYGAINGKRTMPGVTRCMAFTLPYWISNIAYCMMSVINGIARIILKTFDLDTIVKVIQDCKVNITIFTQHVMNDLIKNPHVCQYDTSSLEYVYFGGSKIGQNQISEIQKLFPHTKFLNAFGMTEIGGLMCIPTQELTTDASGNSSSGNPIPGAHYKVVDVTTGECLGPHSKGELRIKYDSVMNGYLHEPEVTAEAFDETGYLKTGDIVYYDENYNFYVVDRLKEIFKYKGTHISPVVIEDVLSLHPDVKECAVIPVPHERDGELPMAVIKLRENAKVTEQDIIQYIKERLSDPYQLRGGIKYVDSIPRTTTGKIRRKHLQDLILNQN